MQRVMIKSTSKVNIANGIWTYNTKTLYVSFDGNFMSVLDGFRQFRKDYMHLRKGAATMPLTSFMGNITMGTHEREFYKKID